MIIPSGSYVTGRITEAQRAGRVKGKAALNLRFEALTLPNGISRDFMSRAGSVEAQGNLDRQEGRITGEGKGGSGTKTVAQTTAAGAGLGGVIGAATGHVGSGLGIGAAAGAAAGLAGVFGKRGEDVVLRQGTTIELVLDRDLYFTPDDLKR
jgi:type IV secretion system protein VirB10